jgi:acyl-[acyl-carrier-protein]-phospholipid O-acyltransferase/long-chain-fatty-acid--[acyl-carrier-protein] ligase
MKKQRFSGPCLFVTNHAMPAQLLELHQEVDLSVRAFLSQSTTDLTEEPWKRKLQAISNDSAGFKEAVEHVKKGSSLSLPPEGALMPWGGLLRLHAGLKELMDEVKCPVIPVWFGKQEMKIGKPIAAEAFSIAKVREALYELGAEEYETRHELQESLAQACVRGLKGKFFQPVVTDAFQNGRQLKGGMVLAVALALSKWIKHHIPESRVGIVLPPGLGAVLVNLATVLADKVPVNLNFTAGMASNEAALRIAKVNSVFTAEAFVAKVKDFPWPKQRWDLARILKEIGKWNVLWRWAVVMGLSWKGIVRLFKISQEGGDREAALLFTSGSSGEPKGVVLTHRNLLGNLHQVGEILELTPESKLLGCLPVFHSFGFTVTLWYPLCFGAEVVTYVSPLEVAKLGEIIERYEVTLVISTPTFLRSYLRRVKPEQLKTVKTVLTGAEKLPMDLASQFEERFHVPVREGYGLTETSPVISTNFIESENWKKFFPGQTRNRRGSVGPVVSGVAVQIRNPETGEPMPLCEKGMIWFKGANIFKGYLNNGERTAEVLQGGWLKTGDVGRMDEDGFLFIEGRLSRFSKIGGEMVPHGVVEQHLNECFHAKDHEHIIFAVVGRPHPEKGEELVVLSVLDISGSDLIKKLHEKGLPNLWIPKVVKRVESIPVLGSGKLDLKQCAALALEKEKV